MTMLTPDDPGSGRLFFWTRQGISLQELYDYIALTVAEAVGGTTPGGGGGTSNVVVGTEAGQAADAAAVAQALEVKAPLSSPALTGIPTAPTAAAGTNTDQLATTAFVLAVGGAPLVSPNFTGNPTAPTPAVGDNDTSIATTAFVVGAVNISSNSVILPNVTSVSAPRNHPVSGAVLAAAPACCVTWTSVGLPAAPTAFDPNGDVWYNKELP
jgi:hypothetical protein